MRRLRAAAVAAAVLMLTTGCGSLATAPTSSPTVTVAPAPAPSPSVPAAASPSPSASTAPRPTATAEPASAASATAPATDSAAPADQCPDDSIGVLVTRADGGGGAGSEQFLVLFTNTGGSPCVLRGTPGVSVVGGADGPRLGPAAHRVQTGVESLRLAVGESVAAPLRIVDIGTDGGPLTGCRVVAGAGYRVFAPHSTRAVFYQDPKAVACADGPVFMTVSPVTRFTG